MVYQQKHKKYGSDLSVINFVVFFTLYLHSNESIALGSLRLDKFEK
jgi:hypothetical protein